MKQFMTWMLKCPLLCLVAWLAALAGHAESSHDDSARQALITDLQRNGVKRAEAVVDFTWWDNHASNVRVVKTLYYNNYATECSQITDPQRLARIRSRGLEEQLASVASESISAWHRGDSIEMPADTHLTGRVEVEDDGRLPLIRSWPALEISPRSIAFIPFADVNDAQKLVGSPERTRDRDRALVQAPTWGDNSCIVDILLRGGANVDAVDGQKSTALMEAAEFGRLHDLKRLLAAGANVNLQDIQGDSALIKAARAHQTEAVKVLLEAHANPLAVSRAGQTALTEALKYDYIDVVDLIQQAEARPVK